MKGAPLADNEIVISLCFVFSLRERKNETQNK
jgi:hypothetical protein